MNKQQQWHVWYVVAAIIGVILIAQLWGAARAYVTPFPTASSSATSTTARSTRCAFPGTISRARGKTPQANGVKTFVTTRVSPDLAAELEKNHVRFSGQVQNNWLSTLLSWVLPTLVFFGTMAVLVPPRGEQPGRASAG